MRFKCSVCREIRPKEEFLKNNDIFEELSSVEFPFVVDFLGLRYKGNKKTIMLDGSYNTCNDCLNRARSNFNSFELIFLH